MIGEYIDIHTHHPTSATTVRTVGVHPWQATMELLPSEAAVVEAEAVGEIGLDKVCAVDFTQQKAVFAAQLDLAERLDKPVVLHCVRAFEEVMLCLEGRVLPAVIFHGFIGTKEQAKRLLQRGYYLSFGMRTGRSPKTIEALQHTPLDRLFVESDEDTTPIETIYEAVAAWRGISVEELRSATLDNYTRLFKKQ